MSSLFRALSFSLSVSLSLSLFYPEEEEEGVKNVLLFVKAAALFFGEIFSRWQKSGALVKTTQHTKEREREAPLEKEEEEEEDDDDDDDDEKIRERSS